MVPWNKLTCCCTQSGSTKSTQGPTLKLLGSFYSCHTKRKSWIETTPPNPLSAWAPIPFFSPLHAGRFAFSEAGKTTAFDERQRAHSQAQRHASRNTKGHRWWLDPCRWWLDPPSAPSPLVVAGSPSVVPGPEPWPPCRIIAGRIHIDGG